MLGIDPFQITLRIPSSILEFTVCIKKMIGLEVISLIVGCSIDTKSYTIIQSDILPSETTWP